MIGPQTMMRPASREPKVVACLKDFGAKPVHSGFHAGMLTCPLIVICKMKFQEVTRKVWDWRQVLVC